MTTIAFADLPEDMQVLIEDLVLQSPLPGGGSVDNDRAVPQDLPLVRVLVSGLPEVPLDPFDRGEAHARAMDLDEVPPVLVADGGFLDGRHRAFRARELGAGTLLAIDLTGIADPGMAALNRLGPYAGPMLDAGSAGPAP